MIQDRIIISIGSSWDFDPTSKHQLMKVLARRNKIVWVNYHGSRRMTLTKGDMGTALAKLSQAVRGVQRVNDSIVQVTPVVIPGAKSRRVQQLNRALLVWQIRRAVEAVARAHRWPVQVWSFAPDVPSLVGQFNEEIFLYYCVDEFSEFDGYDKALIQESERRLIDQAGLVVTSSQKLHDTKRRLRSDVAQITHGVDFDHFSTAWRSPPPKPIELKPLRGPIFGFFGLIHHWLDIDLMVEVARQRPQYEFVLIGEIKTDVSRLEGLANVHLLGRRDYATLPAYCAAFDAALMLFEQSSMTENVNPIKMYEYLAAGLRIVSTPLREAKRFHEQIVFAADAESYARGCDDVLAHRQQGDRARISRSVRSESWESKVEQFSQLIQCNLASTQDESGIIISGSKRRVTPAMPRDRSIDPDSIPDQPLLAQTFEDN